ncbi:MAG: 4Fe-4S binding protein [Treponema sp.]|jgi:epoxyqueuosine reductase QueG|nr:4Fe-4S binding protein [Treponema sp.]
MADRMMTEKIKHLVLSGGMDLVGFAPAGRWKEAPFLLSPMAILKGAKSVIVAGIFITDTWSEMGGEPTPQHSGAGGWMDQNSLLDRIAYREVRILEESGYRAIGVASSNIWRYRKYEGVQSWFTPDLSHILASSAAGLSEIGWSGLAITPEYGPRVRYISVVTDAELEPTPLYNGKKLCDMCGACIKACPTEALQRDFDGEPHVLRIEDKIQRYAYKNIWRCAWAEHFNLDLKSETLKHEHIGEDDIKREIATKGEYAHERGVCQKVCVPPHLRTGEPSFGRMDKNIARMKIGRIYPDDMPTYKKLRDDVISVAVGMGAEIAAAGPLDTTNKFGAFVREQAPGMTHVLALAFRIPDETPEMIGRSSYERAAYSYALHTKMHHILLVAAKTLENEGFYAVSYTGGNHPGNEPANKTGSGSGGRKSLKETMDAFVPTIKDTHNTYVQLTAYALAESVGLGTVGEIFTTPEFGDKVMIGAIATNAPLDTLRDTGRSIAAVPKKPFDAKALRKKLEVLADNHLVSLFGVAGADAFDKTIPALKALFNEDELGRMIIDGNREGAYHGPWISEEQKEDVKIRYPSDYVSGARSVIVLGMHIPQVIVDNVGQEETKQIGTYGYYVYQTTYELYFAAMELCTCLSRLGYKTAVTTNMLGVGSLADSPRGLLPDFRCGAIEGVAAGLGEIVENGALNNPHYGVHTRRIVIVTDAELPADKPLENVSLRNSFKGCLSYCPVGCGGTAKTVQIPVAGMDIPYPLINRHRCDWAKMYSLNKDEGPAMIGNMTHVELGNQDPSLEDIAEGCTHKDQILKHRTVILEPCLKHCS